MPVIDDHQMQPKFNRIRKAVEEYCEYQADNCIMDDGSFRWDFYKKPRKIVAAANWYNGLLLVGARHWDSLMRQQADVFGGIDLIRDWSNGKETQGFITQYGQFLTREEAMIVATESGQITRGKYSDKELFSEDLY